MPPVVSAYVTANQYVPWYIGEVVFEVLTEGASCYVSFVVDDTIPSGLWRLAAGGPKRTIRLSSEGFIAVDADSVALISLAPSGDAHSAVTLPIDDALVAAFGALADRVAELEDLRPPPECGTEHVRH